MAGWLDRQREKKKREMDALRMAKEYRALQSMNQNPEQMQENYPVSQFDVPVDQQIVRYK